MRAFKESNETKAFPRALHKRNSRTSRGCAAAQLLTGLLHTRQAQVDVRHASDGAYCSTSRCLYVSTVYSTPAIVIYRLNQRGHSKPVESIRGGKTTLVSPSSIAVDAQHNIYVANVNDYYQSSILVYSAGSYGNVAPVRTITGPHTKMGILEASPSTLSARSMLKLFERRVHRNGDGLRRGGVWRFSATG